MFKNILIPTDNSEYSDFGVDAAFSIAEGYSSEVTGCHVYAARLHETRFMDMETGLPSQYQSEAVLKRQRKIHESLIAKGLNVIADSYLDRTDIKAKDKGITFKRKSREGKNYIELIKEAEEGAYDLIVIGGFGKGVVEHSLLGGVCERVVRGINKDILVVKNNSFNKKIIVCIDGSPYSYAALITGIKLKKVFGGDIEAIAVFDPYFHRVAFRNIAGVLSEEASKIFKFKEQEKLHDEIIDKGLAKLYESHLDTACRIAKARGVEIKTTLLAGKAFNEVIKAGLKEPSSFIVAGRFGLHYAPESSIGNTVENILKLANANIYISSGSINLNTEINKEGTKGIQWGEGALKRMERVPEFARGMAKKAIEDFASEKGYSVVTEEIVDEVKKRFGMGEDN